MGESQAAPFDPTFNRSVKVDCTQDEITSDAGVLLLREADHSLGLVESMASQLFDPRRPDRIRYTLPELLRERLYSMALGYSVQDDSDRLAHDPAFRMAVWDRRGTEVIDERLASQPTQSRLISILDLDANREVVQGALWDSVERYMRSAGPNRRVQQATIDVDSFPVEVYGKQVGAAYNGHYHATIYHPLVASICIAGKYDPRRPGSRLGNGFIAARLRSGNAHTTEYALEFLEEIVTKARTTVRSFDLRLDAGFVQGEILDYLTDEKVRFVGRIKANARLHELAEPHLRRPPGRPPKDGYERVVELGSYQADGWKHAQRIILVIIDQPNSHGLLFDMPRYFFLITNYSKSERTGQEALDMYRQRGTFEDRLAEFNTVLGPHLSHSEFGKNQISLWLALLAFNLASFLRIELERANGTGWDLIRFRECVLKAGGRVARHSRRLTIKVTQAISSFWSTLSTRIARWKLPPTFAQPSGPRRRPWVPPPRHAHLTLVYRD